ncbi:hypothetical protein [Pontiella sulfatireligans]|uniref:Uncharacterized protein n=1 Tax=Pontiella sulfatireligans TaxID=2750658 RepID=A0A6C2UIH3_9BACT|nr:hypothetical protein [Pontiella sulfatireligans]VGO19006.1 hypothetical protein SCARR_01060 [Pontiella sulfatireligans]
MKKISTLATLIALTVLSMQTAYGQLVDYSFTADEGFETGSIALHPDWYDQNSDYQVDTNGTGTVSVNGAETYRKAINQVAFPSNTQYSVGIEFTFDRIFTNANDKHVISVGFKESPTFAGDRVEMQLSHGVAGFFRLKTSNSGPLVGNEKSGGLKEELLGFSTNETFSSSDNLWFGYAITRGADASSWSGFAVLSNLTAGTEIQSFTVAFDTTQDFFTDDSLYAYINSVNSDAQSFTSNRKIDRFTAGSEDVDVFEQVEEVEFTAQQGYEPGSLFGQQGYWTGNSDQTDTEVDATINYVQLTTNKYKQMTYTLPLSTTNGMLEVGGEFRFDRSINTNATGSFMTFNLVDNFSNFPKFIRVDLQRTSADQLRMVFTEKENGFSAFSDLFDESALGLDGGVTNDSSDNLKLSLKVYPGMSTNDWSAAMVLSNMTAGTQVHSFSVEEGEFIVKESWLDSTLYGGFNSSASETDTYTTNRQIESFYVAVATGGAPVVIPYEEWASEYGVGGMDEDPDEDSLNNLAEYALMGNPTNAMDQGVFSTSTSSVDGTNYLNMMHAMLIDTEGVEYNVEVNDSGNLVIGSWTNTGITVTSGALADDYLIVTNAIVTDDENQGFLRLLIVEE